MINHQVNIFDSEDNLQTALYKLINKIITEYGLTISDGKTEVTAFK
jgi:hypothetical protein